MLKLLATVIVLVASLQSAANAQRQLPPIAPLDVGKSTRLLLTSVIYECERRALRRRLSVDDAYRCAYTKKFAEDAMFDGASTRMQAWLAEQRFFIEAELTP